MRRGAAIRSTRRAPVDWFVIVFRIVHIVAAMAWAGGAALFFFYLEPTMNKLGPDADKFVDELLNKRKLPIYFVAASTIAVLGGAVLYVRDAGGLTLWLNTTPGITYTIGALSAIVAWIGGNGFIPSTVFKIQAVGGEIRAAGGAPSPELMTRLHGLQHRLRMIGAIDLVLIVVAILCMESARYLI
jgi:hypothetical protein